MDLTKEQIIRIAEECGAVIVSMRDVVADVIFEPRDLAEFTNTIIRMTKGVDDNTTR